jgi:hypothetical protein
MASEHVGKTGAVEAANVVYVYVSLRNGASAMYHIIIAEPQRASSIIIGCGTPISARCLAPEILHTCWPMVFRPSESVVGTCANSAILASVPTKASRVHHSPRALGNSGRSFGSSFRLFPKRVSSSVLRVTAAW